MEEQKKVAWKIKMLKGFGYLPTCESKSQMLLIPKSSVNIFFFEICTLFQEFHHWVLLHPKAERKANTEVKVLPGSGSASDEIKNMLDKIIISLADSPENEQLIRNSWGKKCLRFKPGGKYGKHKKWKMIKKWIQKEKQSCFIECCAGIALTKGSLHILLPAIVSFQLIFMSHIFPDSFSHSAGWLGFVSHIFHVSPSHSWHIPFSTLGVESWAIAPLSLHNCLC